MKLLGKKFFYNNITSNVFVPNPVRLFPAIDDAAAAARDFFEKHLSMQVIKGQLADILADMGL